MCVCVCVCERERERERKKERERESILAVNIPVDKLQMYNIQVDDKRRIFSSKHIPSPHRKSQEDITVFYLMDCNKFDSVSVI